MEDISPEHVQDFRWDEKAAHRHPETICERSKSKGDDEVREDGGDKNDKRFSGDKVKEQPHNPGEEGLGCGLEIGEPVRDAGEEDGDEEEEGEADEEVREHEGSCAVEAVGTLFDECGTVF